MKKTSCTLEYPDLESCFDKDVKPKDVCYKCASKWVATDDNFLRSKIKTFRDILKQSQERERKLEAEIEILKKKFQFCSKCCNNCPTAARQLEK